jgi:hypothetical protein
VTVQEASSLTGLNYGAGVDTVANGIKVCNYRYQTTDLLTVGVAKAPDLATAQAVEAQALAALQNGANNGLSVTQLQGVGDAAVLAQGSESSSGVTVTLAGIYVLKGTTFFGIADVGANHTAPSAASLQAQAMTVLSRL